MIASSPFSLLVPGVASPTFIQPAHGGDNFRRPDAPDLLRSELLPPLPCAENAGDDSAWKSWDDWHLAVALLPERDTVNGEYFDLRAIKPAIGTCLDKKLSEHVQRLYPNWEGRYQFRLVHVLRIIKRYQQDGRKRHSREELIRLAREKHFGSSEPK